MSFCGLTLLVKFLRELVTRYFDLCALSTRSVALDDFDILFRCKQNNNP